MNQEIIFHQLFEAESSTYTYLIADAKTKEAALIDSVIETIDRDLRLVDELGLKLVYVLDTHIHADHITAAGEIRKRTSAKTGVSKHAAVPCVDIPLSEGQELFLGDKKIKVIETPGHTETCLSYLFEGRIFTGDALLIRGCGRTDFQNGSSEKLYRSVHEKLFNLSEDLPVYPGHDYRGHTVSSIGAEKKYNPRLAQTKSVDDFVKIMSELNLASPKKIHEAVPANLACGIIANKKTFIPQLVDGVPEVSVEEVFANRERVSIVDVRRSDEFNGELGHIQGAQLVTLGPQLSDFLENGDREKQIVFICRSGGRSGTAAKESLQKGYKKVVSMTGGMLRWCEKKQPVEE